MHAIIETGGKQYKVTEGDTLFIEKLASEAGENVTFDKVLAVIDGDKITVGTPVVEGAKVDASVVKNVWPTACTKKKKTPDFWYLTWAAELLMFPFWSCITIFWRCGR